MLHPDCSTSSPVRIKSATTNSLCLRRTVFSNGTWHEISAKIGLYRRNMFRLTLSATRIWTITAHGAPTQCTAMFGFRMVSLLTGLRTTMDAGLTSPRGAGLGWKMNRGVLHRFTTAAGLLWAEAGAGFRVPRRLWALPIFDPCMLPRSWRSWAEAVSPHPSTSAVRAEWAWPGFLSAHATCGFLPITSARLT